MEKSENKNSSAWVGISNNLFSFLMFLTFCVSMAHCHTVDGCTKKCDNPDISVLSCKCD